MLTHTHAQILLDVSNDDLEAEFLAMTGGKGSGKKKGKSGSNQMSMDDIDKVVASVKDIGEGDDDDEDLGSLSDIDDDDLLAELQVCVYVCVYAYLCISLPCVSAYSMCVKLNIIYMYICVLLLCLH